MKSDGFTLIEVMISLVVLMVGMLGVMGMQYYAITGNTSSRDLTNATNLGLDLIEQLKTTPYSMISTGTDSPTAEAATTGNVQFDRAWSVVADCMALADDGDAFPPLSVCATQPDGAVSSAVSAIRVKTRWIDKNGDYHFTTFESLRWDENVIP